MNKETYYHQIRKGLSIFEQEEIDKIIKELEKNDKNNNYSQEEANNIINKVLLEHHIDPSKVNKKALLGSK